MMNTNQRISLFFGMLTAGLFYGNLSTQAQVGIGVATPDASAQLHVESTSKGLLVPRVASTSAVSAPAKGLLVYQTGAPEGFYYNSGTSAAPVWTPMGAITGSVSTTNTLSGNGSSGSPLAINTANSNTWTANQTFAGTFLITANSRIAMTNSDNNARDIRFQEPSGTGSQYVGFRAPSVTNNGNYVFPSAVGSVGQVLGIATSNGIDSATMEWINPPAAAAVAGYAGNATNANIAVVLGGTAIPLPSDQNLSGITTNGANTVFTVPSSGNYRIEYRINLASPLLASSRVVINGAPSNPLVVTPNTSTSSLNASAIVSLPAGSTVSLQLFGLVGVATLSGNQGASLTITKL